MTDDQSPLLPDTDMRTPAALKVLKAGLIGFFSLMVLSVIYGAAWYYVASQLEAGIDEWRAQQRAHGLDVQFEKRVRAGFPGSIAFKLTSPSVTQSGTRNWHWSAEQLTLSMKPWAPNHIQFDGAGIHQGHYMKAGTRHDLEGSVQKWRGSIDYENGVARQIQTELGGLSMSGLAANELLQISGAEISVMIAKDKNPEFVVRVRQIDLPLSFKAPLGPQVSHFDARGTLTGDIRSEDLEKALVAWRDSGGTLDFTNLDLDYSPLRVRGDGTLALDAHMQPVAAFSVKAEGFFATVDALHGQGLIPLGTSFATKIALGVLSKTPEGGGAAYLDLPITVQDQTLYAGSIKLLKLRPIHW